MADTPNVDAPTGPTNDTEPTGVYVANPNAEILNEPTTNDQTDQYSTNYNNPPLSEIQVGITQNGTVIPLDPQPLPEPVNLTNLSNLTQALFSGITTNQTNNAKILAKWYNGFSIILHFNTETYSFPAIFLPFPQYLTFSQINTLAQDLISMINSNPTQFAQYVESTGTNQDIITNMSLSAVTGITVVGTHFDWLASTTPTPVYT